MSWYDLLGIVTVVVSILYWWGWDLVRVGIEVASFWLGMIIGRYFYGWLWIEVSTILGTRSIMVGGLVYFMLTVVSMYMVQRLLVSVIDGRVGLAPNGWWKMLSVVLGGWYGVLLVLFVSQLLVNVRLVNELSGIVDASMWRGILGRSGLGI